MAVYRVSQILNTSASQVKYTALSSNSTRRSDADSCGGCAARSITDWSNRLQRSSKNNRTHDCRIFVFHRRHQPKLPRHEANPIREAASIAVTLIYEASSIEYRPLLEATSLREPTRLPRLRQTIAARHLSSSRVDQITRSPSDRRRAMLRGSGRWALRWRSATAGARRE